MLILLVGHCNILYANTKVVCKQELQSEFQGRTEITNLTQ
jgi:hypothetical protein